MTLSRAKSIAVDWLAAFSNWLDNVTGVHSRDPEAFVEDWRDHVRWKIERLTDPLWGFLMDGSDCEIESTLHGEIPWEYMNQRQRAACIHPVRMDQFDSCWIVRNGQIIEVRPFELDGRYFYVRRDNLQIVE